MTFQPTPIARLRSRRNVLLAAAMLGPVLASVSVVHRTGAAYSAKTNNPGDTWTSGQLALTDDDLGAAMFSVTNIQPGDSGSRCLKVTYNGTLAPSAIRFYAVAPDGQVPPTGAIADQMMVQVDMDKSAAGTGRFTDGGSSCILSGSVASIVSSRSLKSLMGTYSTFGTGAAVTGAGPGWTPAGDGTNTYRVFKISWSLPSTALSSAQSTSQSVNFIWEAQS